MGTRPPRSQGLTPPRPTRAELDAPTSKWQWPPTRRRFFGLTLGGLTIGGLTGFSLLDAGCDDSVAAGTGGTGGAGGSGAAGGAAGLAGGSGGAGGAGAVCTLTPEQEEGPFYVDEGLLRADITDGETGVPLQLAIVVVNATTCLPIANVAVDIWAANHVGNYSDEAQSGTVGQKFQRGVQISDDAGKVTFTAIYPGWYPGRAIHIHLKVRVGGTASGSSYSTTGSTVAHGGQMFFPSDQNDAMRAIYSDNTNSFINNDADRVYTQQGGSTAVLTLVGTSSAGFTASITVAVAS